MIKYDKTKWVDGTTVLRASHMEKIEKGITDIIDYNNSIYTDEAKRKENEIKREEEHSRKMNEVSEVVSDIQKDYDSLKKVIIDENASANLQNQINQTNSQLGHKMNIFKITQSDSFEYIKNVLENNDNCKIIFENGNYLFDSEILIKNKQGINIDFSNSTITVGELQPLKSILKLDSCSNIVISNGNLNGNRTINSQNTGPQDGGNHGISIRDCCCIHVRNCKIYECSSDGVYIGRLTKTNESANTDIHFINCTMDNNMRQGVSIISLSNSSFINCNFINTNGKAPEAGIDIEPNNFEVIRNLHFKDCKFNGNNGRGFVIDDGHASTITSLSFEQCVFTDNNYNGFVVNLNGIAQEAHKIYLNKCNIDSIYSSGIESETLLYVNDCTMGSCSIVKNMYANIYTSKMNALSMLGGQVVVDNCIFDGKGRKDAIYWHDFTNDVDLSIIRNCIFKNYNRWFLVMANYSIVENCIFLTDASEEYANESQAIEPSNKADINLLIKDCIFKRKPIRFPSRTTGVTVLNCGSIVGWATSTTNTLVNCYTF